MLVFIIILVTQISGTRRSGFHLDLGNATPNFGTSLTSLEFLRRFLQYDPIVLTITTSNSLKEFLIVFVLFFLHYYADWNLRS